MNLFDIDKIEAELKELENQTIQEGFWNDSKTSSKVLTRIKQLKSKCTSFRKIETEIQNMQELTELVELEPDEDVAKDILKNTKKIEKELEKLELETLLSGKYDENNAIVTIHPGAGGTESQDWAEMLYRMYTRWANKNNYEVRELDYLEGEEAGLKSVTFEVIGQNAYGYLKCEKGVHRLVRISPFDAGARRHTSFASVDVIPKFEKNDIDIEVLDSDIRVDVYRSSGCGGQGVNTTDSAVRITHLKTGIVVTCQNERSQIQNKERAMEVLKNKLYQLEIEKRNQEMQELKGKVMDINFGSQIRSYVMHPYSLVKDHRTNIETSNVGKVLDGDIDLFIHGFLKGSV